MKIWRDGDEARAICPACKKRTRVIFQRRVVDVEIPAVQVKDVLVAVCMDCEAIAMIPHQSAPKLRVGLERRSEVVNARLPGHLVDVLSMLADRWAPGARSGVAAVLRVLLHRFGNDPAFARCVAQHVTDPLAQGPGDHDVSVRVPAQLLVAVDDMTERLGMATRSEALRALLVRAKIDVLDEGDPTLMAAMERALAAVG